MRYVPRALAGTLRRAVRTFPAVLVTGPRQSGKTTLLREELGGTHAYVSLERPDVQQRAVADPMAFLGETTRPVILDEIQYVPGLLPYIKERIDEDRRPGRWVLTGSQSFPVMRGVGESLAGRIAVLTLDPFSTREACELRHPESFEELIECVFASDPRRARKPAPRGPAVIDWLLRGGYPEPRLNTEVDRQLWYSGYVQTYLERDVRDLVQVGDLGSFRRFLFFAASRNGSLVNMSEIGRDVGVTGPTAKRWLSVLETSQVICLLKPYHRSFGKRVRKQPKLYFMDPGLVTFLLGLHAAEPIFQGPSFGALMECCVVSEWLKSARQLGQSVEFHYWRSSQGAEVDLVFEWNGVIHGIEAKATSTPNPHHASSLSSWLALAGPKACGVLACNIDAPAAVSPRVRAVPWHMAWWT